MKTTWLVMLAVGLSVGGGVAVMGCHEEPTIVIKFEPNTPSASPSASPVAVVAAPQPSKAAADPAAALHQKAECKSSADCVVEPVECCSCLKGGKQEALSKKAAATLTKQHAKECQGMMCAMMISHDPSCAEKAACVAGQCALVEKSAK